MKRKICILFFILVVIICSILACVKNSERKKRIRMYEALMNKSWNDLYTEALCIKGDFSYDSKKVYVNNIEKYRNCLLLKIASYNHYHTDCPVSSELLFQEYENFCNGEDESEYENLHHYACWHSDNKSLQIAFESYVGMYYSDKSVFYDDETTPEELQEAIDHALPQLEDSWVRH